MSLDHAPEAIPLDSQPPPTAAPGRRRALGWLLAGAAFVAVGLAACAAVVPAGTALLVTEFGQPVGVLRQPGLAWKLPWQRTLKVDLRVRVASAELQEIGLRDGKRVLLQAFLVWRVGDTAADIGQFVRAARNDADTAAGQLRSLAAAALERAAAGFAFADLVNADPTQPHLDALEARLKAEISPELHRDYGIAVLQAGIERLSLPEPVLQAQAARVRSERETAWQLRSAEAAGEAARIRAEASRDSRIMLADANAEAASIEAGARREAADIEQKAYAADPQLYSLLRSLDTLAAVVGSNTRLVLRTDAAPFSALVAGPPGTGDTQK